MSADDMDSHMPGRWIGGALVFAGAGATLSGLVTMVAWVLPAYFHGFLPHAALDALEATHDARAPIAATHLVLGVAIVALAVAYVALAFAGRASDPRPRAGTATTLLVDWLLGLPTFWRRGRARFRDALVAPRFEAAVTLSVGIATVPLMLAPMPLLAALGGGLHRANALYAVGVGAFWLLVALFRPRPRPAPREVAPPVVANPRVASFSVVRRGPP